MPRKRFKSIFTPFLSAIFVVFSQKSNLNRKIYVFRLFPTEWMFPRLALTLCQAKNFFASFMNGDCTQAMQQIMAVMLAVKWQCPQLVPSLSLALSQVLSQVLSQDEEKDASIDAKDATSSSKVATLDEKVASLEPKDTKVKKKA